jgi:hypothetical protein
VITSKKSCEARNKRGETRREEETRTSKITFEEGVVHGKDQTKGLGIWSGKFWGKLIFIGTVPNTIAKN